VNHAVAQERLALVKLVRAVHDRALEGDPRRYDLTDSAGKMKHVCKSPEAAKAVAQTLNRSKP